MRLQRLAALVLPALKMLASTNCLLRGNKNKVSCSGRATAVIAIDGFQKNESGQRRPCPVQVPFAHLAAARMHGPLN